MVTEAKLTIENSGKLRFWKTLTFFFGALALLTTMMYSWSGSNNDNLVAENEALEMKIEELNMLIDSGQLQLSEELADDEPGLVHRVWQSAKSFTTEDIPEGYEASKEWVGDTYEDVKEAVSPKPWYKKAWDNAKDWFE